MIQHLEAFKGQLAIHPAYIDTMAPAFQSFLSDAKVRADLVARYEDHIKRRRVGEEGLESLSTGTENVQVVGSTAIMHIPSVITKRYGFFSWWFGGSASDDIALTAKILGESDQIDNVVINMDSPGGSVNGVALAAEAVRELRSNKNVITVANDLMASAGYWIGSAADQILINPSSIVGSIGVFAQIVNYARLLEELKIDVEIIRAGKFKATPNSVEPLTDEGRAIVQRGVNYHYGQFIQAISLNRNISMSEAKDKANGLVHEGQDAIEAGLADGEGTLANTVEQLEESSKRKSVFQFAASLLPGSKKATVQAEEAEETEAAAEETEQGNDAGARLAEMEARFKALEAQNERMASLLEQQTTALEQSALGALKNENSRFVDHLKSNGQVRASSADGYLAVLNHLAGVPEDEQTVAFGDEKTTIFAFLRRELNAALPIVSLDEAAPAEGKAAGSLPTASGIAKEEVGDLKTAAKAYADAEEAAGRPRPAAHVAIAKVLAERNSN